MRNHAGDASRLLTIQAVATALAAAVFLALSGQGAAQAALFGGVAAMISAWMLARRVRMATEVARDNPGQ